MNPRSSLTVVTLILACLMMLTSGCSETTKEAPPLPEIVSPVYFPLIQNGTLYSINHETLELEKLVEFPNKNVLALDTDESEKVSDDSTVSFLHTALPEYIAYSDAQNLFIYDLNTRFTHHVFSFESDQFNSEASTGYICDLQKVITWDEESRLDQQFLLKDEFSVYVKTSSNNDCSKPDEGFQYWQINIIESTNKNDDFTIRRKDLKEHSHEHKHFHSHDDTDSDDEFFEEHQHQHTLEEDELDENGEKFKPNNHKHKHKNNHDFLFGFEHSHDGLTKEEIDAVHNDPKNHEIRFEKHPLLIGIKTSIAGIDEALMYSGAPVLNFETKTFGYLGINTEENAFKFYTVNTQNEELIKRELWTLSHEDFISLTNTRNEISDVRKLIPDTNRYFNFYQLDNVIILGINNKVIYFDVPSLFSQKFEATEQRINNISNPLFVRNMTTPYLNYRVEINDLNNKMAIVEGNEVWSVDLSTSPIEPASLIKQYSIPDLATLIAFYIGDDIIVVKNTEKNETLDTSIVQLQETGLEINTLIPSFPGDWEVQWYWNNFLVRSVNDNQNVESRFISSFLGSPLTFEHAFWSDFSVDYRNNSINYSPFLLSSNAPGFVTGSINSPELTLFEPSNELGKGESFGFIPQDVLYSSTAVIFNQFYGLIEVTSPDNESTSTYFFSNEQSTFNIDNELETMKPLTPHLQTQ